MAQPASLALEGGAPRLQHKIDEKVDANTTSPASPARGGIPPHARGLHDPDITFEEYYYYAQLTRQRRIRRQLRGMKPICFPLSFPPNHKAASDTVISDEEWTNASRALRTATRGAAFYLITTDILGPFGLPYAFATMGWGPGVALYTVFAGLAGYSGYLLWDIFLGLDSYQFPVLSFGDLGYRLYGPYMRYLFNFLQGIQLLLNVGIIVISNGEALSQATKFKLCFIVCCLIWAIVGFFMGQIRTLQKFGWLANVAVWINLICMFITMGTAAHTAPNFAGAGASAGATIAGGALVTPNAQGVFPPVQTSGGIPDTGSFVASVSGAMQAIFAYGGSMVFPEFMAEMRRPKDFLTAMWAAQAFIYFWYMFYGLFMYGFQGQYVINPSYLGIGPYNLQTAGNVFAMVSAVIAAALYGNIGIKVIYNNVFVEVFRAPGLNTTAGRWAWACLIPLYWAIAFVLAAGIPNFAGLTSVVAAFCILHFTYTFPPMLSVMFWMKRHALQEGEGYHPTTGQTVRHDSGFKRMARGFMARRWWVNVANIIYMLGALALGGLGAYSSIIVLTDAFKSNRMTSFVCKSPLDG
ncbi:putative amino acid transporter [Mycena rebaudengoi]|nr:putative amino acid transporter [Mycena rebaudengoi]